MEALRLDNHCVLVAMEVQDWAKAHGWRSRILMANAGPNRTWHAVLIFEYEGRLRDYDPNTGTGMLPKTCKLSDPASRIGPVVWRWRGRKKNMYKLRAKWVTPIV